MKRNELKYRLLRSLLKILTALPLRALYIFSDTACLILHRVLKYRVKVIRKNLRSAFPEKSDEELRTIERKFYRYLCDVFVEVAKLAHISDAEIDRRVHINGAEDINAVLDKGKSVVLLLGHFGNWEWVTCAARKFLPAAVTCEIYHPLRNKVMDRLMLDLRSRFGTENIPMNNTVRHLLQIHRDGRNFVCGFISDQRPFTHTLKHWTDFMGLDTPYVNGGEMIGTKLGADFFYAEMKPVRRGHYELNLIKIHPLDDGDENPYTRAYMQLLEESIRQNPPYWLWSHNRWKRSRSSE